MVERRSYFDNLDEVSVVFHSDAPQSLIDSLSFEGYWETVRRTLRAWGYQVIEHPIPN